MKNRRFRSSMYAVVCISAALICIALTFWGNFRFGGVITIDAYLGVIATFIGICAAIVVGFQLYSYFEFRELKERINRVEVLKSQWEKERDEFAEEIHLTKNGVANAFRLLHRLNRQNPNAPVLTVVAILTYDLKTIGADTSGFMLNRYRELDRMLTGCRYNHRLLRKYLPDLNALEIPRQLDHYNEIMALHYKIITRLESSSRS